MANMDSFMGNAGDLFRYDKCGRAHAREDMEYGDLTSRRNVSSYWPCCQTAGEAVT